MADREVSRSAVPASREAEQRAAESVTVIAREDSFEGAMRIKGDGTVLGGFEGEIECGGELMIGREAEVAANIRATNITIAGHVQGNVLASGRLRITATGRLEGDAKVGALVVQEGGVHLGMIKVHPEGIPADDHRVTPLIQRPAPRQQLTGQSPQSGHAQLPEQAGNGSGANGANGGNGVHLQNGDPTQTPVDRVKKLWGEFF